MEHLADALYFGWWKEGIWAVLTFYADASGSEHDQAVTVVAGFINSANNWVDFDREWRAFLDLYGVPYLHMKEFAHSKGPFEIWRDNETTRQKFLADALRIIQKNGCTSFVTAIHSQAFNDVIRARHLLPFFGNAYLFAARTCLSSILGWCGDKRMNAPLEYIFEAGDAKQGVLREIMKSDGMPEPIFRHKCDVDPARSILPLQAADFLAYEIAKGFRDIGKRQMRQPLAEFNQMVGPFGDWGIYENDNMELLLTVNENVRRLEAVLGKWKGPATVEDFRKEGLC